jgi:hypothetical protein
LEVTEWEDSRTPKLNGQLLPLMQYERSRSLALAKDGQSFVLGTEWRVRLFDPQGKEIWKTPVPGVAWSVNIAGNGKLVVAAFGDGTIRWYRKEDGKELCALFPHKDRKRWVLWTARGYYDASPGAEDLIGWHVNRKRDEAADFFPAAQFRSVYYRPDVVAKVLDTLDEAEALRRADEDGNRKRKDIEIQKMLPPVVTILSPSDREVVSSTQVLVKFSLRSPSGEKVTAIRVLVDGRPVETQRGLDILPAEAAGEEVREVTVVIPEKDCEISILAENRYTTSVPATVRIQWQGKVEFVLKPKLYVLAVGVSQYQDPTLRLNFAAKDAKDFVDVMQRQEGGLYEKVVVKLLTDADASKDEIMDGLEWVQKETTAKDMAMIFFAGHGVNAADGIYYFLPVNTNRDKLKRTAVAYSEIKNTVAALPGKAVLFVDTCHSGNVWGARRGNTDLTGILNDLSSAENGAVVFAASTGRQYSLENKDWQNGAFTKALVEGLSGKADIPGKGKIMVSLLEYYICERVKELTKGQQTPVTTKPQTIPDFPIAVKRD